MNVNLQLGPLTARFGNFVNFWSKNLQKGISFKTITAPHSITYLFCKILVWLNKLSSNETISRNWRQPYTQSERQPKNKNPLNCPKLCAIKSYWAFVNVIWKKSNEASFDMYRCAATAMLGFDQNIFQVIWQWWWLLF
jgi:hypothetical protein